MPFLRGQGHYPWLVRSYFFQKSELYPDRSWFFKDWGWMVGKSWKPVKATGTVTIWCRIPQIMIWYPVIFYWFLTTRDGCGCYFWWSVFIWCQDHTNIPFLDEFAEPLKTLTQVLQLQGPMGPSQASFRGDDCKASWPRRNRSGEKRPQLRRSLCAQIGDPDPYGLSQKHGWQIPKNEG